MTLLLSRFTPAFLAAFALAPSGAFAQSTARVSVDSAGVEGNRLSSAARVSQDGRIVAFQSEATNLVPGDGNNNSDVFVHDRETGLTTLVSVDSAGVHGNYGSEWPSLSADGRFVAFHSYAQNLVPGDVNNHQDVFVHDRQTGQTVLVSVSTSGVQGNSYSNGPRISADGRFVAFHSEASTLVPGDTNNVDDVFLRDLETGETTRVSVSSGGVQGNANSAAPSISADGGIVAFWSWASTLVPGDTNGYFDIFVHERRTGVTTRVSVDSGGAQGNGPCYSPSITANGRFVAFFSGSTNLVVGDTNGEDDVFVHDRETGQTTRVSVNSAGVQGNEDSKTPSISAHGRFVTFESEASNLVPGDTNDLFDVFVHDRLTGETTRASVDSAGVQGDKTATAPSISADGRFVVFESFSTNLVPGDANEVKDVFVRDRQAIAPALASQGSCPGPMTLTLDAATPEGRVAFALGVAGSFTLSSSVCAGTTLDLDRPKFGPVLRASWQGMIVSSYPTTPAMCGRSVQTLDLSTCRTSNTVVL